MVNDRIGFERTEETFELYFVKSKNESHNDLLDAFNAANLGFKMLGTNEAQGTMKLNEAIPQILTPYSLAPRLAMCCCSTASASSVWSR